MYANYSFVDPTFQSTLELASPNNPSPDVVPCAGDPTENCIIVQAGRSATGHPSANVQGRFRVLADAEMEIRIGFGRREQSSVLWRRIQLEPAAGGLRKVNLHTSYDVTDHIQVYGLINNLFNNHFGTFGNYFNTAEGTEASLGTINFTDARTIVPAQPFAAYGGLRIKF